MLLLKILWRVIVLIFWRLPVWLLGLEEQEETDDFYRSKPWRDVARKARAECVRHWGRLTCERWPGHAGPFHVDHIRPRSRFPRLELDQANTQVLCALCNIRKGARFGFNWRRLNRAGLWWLRLLLVGWQAMTGRR